VDGNLAKVTRNDYIYNTKVQAWTNSVTHGGKGPRKLALKQQVLILLPNEPFAELIVGEATNTEGGKDAETASKRYRLELLTDDTPSIGVRYGRFRGRWPGVEIHGMNMKWRRYHLNCRGDSQRRAQFGNVRFNAMILLQIFGSKWGL